MYLIRGLEPRTDITMGAHGFSIELSPAWKDMVAACGLDQGKVDHKIQTCGNDWLDSCGYNRMSSHDPTQRLYDARHAIRIQWGVWGPEHISVPGNACGLDIDSHAFGAFIRDARILTPHNIDCWSQKQCLLMAFCSFAEDVVLFSRSIDK
jgi:hypothetical protein